MSMNKKEHRERTVTAVYTNWKNETEVRRFIPLELYFGKTEYHPEEQWLLLAWDLEKEAERTYALKDFHGGFTGSKHKSVSEIIKGKISWKKMKGKDDLEKKINCYLTKQFIMSRDIPSDECLDEAKYIIATCVDELSKPIK